jgi:glycosyltransferase involved in cell wall biosynthesis
LIFVKLLRHERPDKVIVCNGGYPAAMSCLSMVLASKLLKIPVIKSIVSVPVKRRNFIRLYDNLLDYFIWISVEYVIVNCLAIKNQLNLLRSLPLEKIKVIYNGIQNVKYYERTIFKDKEVVLGLVSRMDCNKGVFLLLSAFSKLYEKHKNIKLILVGAGEAIIELKEQIKQYNLLDIVELLGFYEGNIDNVLNKIDIFVFPSLWEGLPYSIIEACRAGCAIVATEVGGISEVIENNYNGIIVSPNSELELCNAISYLINNKFIAGKLALSARKTYEEKFQLEYMHERVKKY